MSGLEVALTSGGIEPLFARVYRREHTLGVAPLVETNPIFLRYAEQHLADAERLLAEVLARGSLRDVDGISEAVRRLFVTAAEIPFHQHLRIQEAFQHHVDNAVSKTIDLPAEAQPADVAQAYMEAWRLGQKAFTIYRTGSRDRQVLTFGAGYNATSRDFFAKCDPGACRL
jgi:ribonucleoside-diphosphate reductase alpha chain